MIIAATGHRPDKLCGYSNVCLEQLTAIAIKYFKQEKPDEIISGMALGWDTAIASAAIALDIPLIAAVPFKFQYIKWNQESIKQYRKLLGYCHKIVYVDSLENYKLSDIADDMYHPAKMEKRNQWMIDNCDKVVALYNGDKKGGTANCVKYAVSQSKTVDNLWDVYSN